jgi:hypothetical protein
VYVTVTMPGYRQALSFVAAVTQVAAALRARQPVTVAATDAKHPTRWALSTDGHTITAEPANPTLFAPAATPAWVEQLAAAAADLL